MACCNYPATRHFALVYKQYTANRSGKADHGILMTTKDTWQQKLCKLNDINLCKQTARHKELCKL